MSENLLKLVPQNFIMGGNCTFTLVSDAGEHRTYKVNQSDPVYNVEGDEDSGIKWPAAYWVALLTGPDNTSDYRSFAKVNEQTGELRPVGKSGMTMATEAFALAQLVIDYAFQGKELPEGLWLQLPSRCGRCGRKLTAPKEQNPYFPWFGPECGSK